MPDIVKKIFPYLIIIVAVCSFYIQNLKFEYSYLDDNFIIFQDHSKINSIDDISSAFKEGYLYNTYYRPMVMISFIIDTFLGSQSPSINHLTNLFLHIMVCFLIYSLLIKLTKEKLLSLIFTLIFSLHPININAVTWIAGRNDLLVTLFTLLAFSSFIKYCKSSKKVFLVIVSIFYLFALFSKETGVLIPLLLIFYYELYGRNKLIRFRSIWPSYKYLLLPFFIPLLVYIILRFFVSPVSTKEAIGLNSLINNIYIPFEYLAKTVYYFDFSPLSMFNVYLSFIGVLITLFTTLIIFYNKNINKKN